MYTNFIYMEDHGIIVRARLLNKVDDTWGFVLNNHEKRLRHFIDTFAPLVLYFLPSYIYIYQQILDQPPIRAKIQK